MGPPCVYMCWVIGNMHYQCVIVCANCLYTNKTHRLEIILQISPCFSCLADTQTCINALDQQLARHEISTKLVMLLSYYISLLNNLFGAHFLKRCRFLDVRGVSTQTTDTHITFFRKHGNKIGFWSEHQLCPVKAIGFKDFGTISNPEMRRQCAECIDRMVSKRLHQRKKKSGLVSTIR